MHIYKTPDTKSVLSHVKLEKALETLKRSDVNGFLVWWK